jgi:hypothetical protein
MSTQTLLPVGMPVTQVAKQVLNKSIWLNDIVMLNEPASELLKEWLHVCRHAIYSSSIYGSIIHFDLDDKYLKHNLVEQLMFWRRF